MATERLIGLTGRKGSGKDHVGKVIARICHRRMESSFKRVAFGDPIKDVAAIVFRVPRHVFDLDDKARENYLTGWLWSDVDPEIQKEFPKRGEYVTVREAGQLIGYDLFRKHFSPIIWIKWVEQEIRRATQATIIVTDVRFPEEALMLGGLGARIIRVVDPDAPPPPEGHSTETKMDAIQVAHTILNDRRKQPFELELEVDNVVFQHEL